MDEDAIGRLRDAAEAPDFSGTRYEIIEPIARGGMGIVYRARDRELDRDVAVKVLRVRELSDEARGRMQAEARTLARLEHPAVVPVHDAGLLPDGRVFYAMKLVRGMRLDEFARERPDREELLRVFGRVCEAVAFAHSQGVVHRDLKPSNVMVGAFGEVQVMDWGLARRLEPGESAVPAPEGAGIDRAAALPADTTADTTGTGAILGTPGYMAPEQARGESARADARSDVYALGVLLRFLATTTEGGRIPRRLRAIIDHACAHDPADRYLDVTALAADVTRLVAGHPVSAYDERFLERARRLASRHRTAIALVAGYLFLRVIIFLVNRF